MEVQINARECCWWDSCDIYTDKYKHDNSWCRECHRNNIINRHDKKIDNYRNKEQDKSQQLADMREILEKCDIKCP